MGNSYSSSPAIIPGNLTVTGNLNVQGSQIQLGANPRKYRIQENANGEFFETVNLDALAVAQDDAASPSQRRRMYPTSENFRMERQAAGSPGTNTLLMSITSSLIAMALDEIRCGQASPYVRIVKNGTTNGQFTLNLGKDLATRDNGAQQALSNSFEASTGTETLRRINGAGAVMDIARSYALATDSTTHTITGVTGAQTILSRTIRGNIIGANGIVGIEVFGQMQNTTAGGCIIDVNYGGVLILRAQTFAIATVATLLKGIMAAKNATNAQQNLALVPLGAQATVSYNTITAVDTTADQTLTVTVTPSVVGDTISIYGINIVLANSFGPV